MYNLITVKEKGFGSWKDTEVIPLMFSERQGFKKCYRIGKWSFKFI